MKKIIIYITFSVITFIVGYSIGHSTIKDSSYYASSSEELALYYEYYDAVEELLDTLENDCNWVDRYDPYNYYNAVHKIYNFKTNK